jgi:hypothetical protein
VNFVHTLSNLVNGFGLRDGEAGMTAHHLITKSFAESKVPPGIF